MKAKKPSLVQARRTQWADGKLPGNPQKQNLWIVSGFESPPQQIVLLGDPRREHYFYTEGDPAVATATYNPDPIKIHGPAPAPDSISFDAIVHLSDGSKQCRSVLGEGTLSAKQQLAREWRQEVATSLRARYVEVTIAELDKHRMRVLNWSRLVAAYRRCRSHPLGLLQQVILARLQNVEAASIAEVISWHPNGERALIIAAVASLLRRRLICSDLDGACLSWHTRLWGGAQHEQEVYANKSSQRAGRSFDVDCPLRGRVGSRRAPALQLHAGTDCGLHGRQARSTRPPSGEHRPQRIAPTTQSLHIV